METMDKLLCGKQGAKGESVQIPLNRKDFVEEVG
jgi:hypothetical protein